MTFDASHELRRLREMTQHNVEHIEKTLRGKASWLRDDMEKMLKSLDRGSTISSVGEVQGKGGYIDSLCGRLNEARDLLRYLDGLQEEENQDVVEAIMKVRQKYG